MKNQIKTLLLLGVLSAILIGVGGFLGPGYLHLFAGLALVMNLGAYFFSDRLVLRLHRAQELDRRLAPEIHEIVEELSREAEIPKPRVFLIPDWQPNAFATGRNPKNGVVAVTQGIVDLLSTRELRAVLAHEIGHIKNRDILVATIAAAIAGIVTYVAHATQFLALFGGLGDDGDEEGSVLGSLALAIVAPIAATLVQLGISRSREYLADETGARISGDPQALASALAKLESAAQQIPAQNVPATASLFIVNPFAGNRTLLNLFSTHPPVRERISNLNELVQRNQRSRRLSWQPAWRPF
mgnify:CR=1 FL=1